MADGLVIFDIGGTLVEGPAAGPAKRLAARLGLDDETRRALSRTIMTRRFAGPVELAAHVGVPGAERAVRELWAAQEAEALPVEGALEALAALGGHRLALISNIWPPYLTAVRRHFGAFFDAHVPPELQLFSFEQGVEKPSPEMFEAALRVSGVPAGRCVMVGDSYSSDLEPAARLGMHTVWTLHRPEKEVSDLVRILDATAPPPSRTVASVASVTDALIEGLLG